jgi:hypothetical protein
VEALIMNEQKERYEELTEAASEALRREVPEIEAALSRIQAAVNTADQECACCHLKVKVAWRDSQLGETLRGIRNKLRRWEDEAGGRKMGAH